MAKKRKAGAKGAQQNLSLKNKINISWRNFVIFLALFLVSFVLYNISSSSLFLNLFGLLSIIFGFLSLALLIVLVVFLILKSGKK